MWQTTYQVNSSECVQVSTGFSILEEILAPLLAEFPAVLWVIDANVYQAHKERLESLRKRCSLQCLVIVPPGEASKCREQKAHIEDKAFEAGIGRDGLIVAVGGGVVGDLAGYVAATYMRGIALVQVPTSIVAMVDSSLGGKTGIDVPAGKNLVGAFKHPLHIIADLGFLPTLPDTEYRDGFAEAIKHGAILDAELFQALEEGVQQFKDRDESFLKSIIPWNQRTKIGVVIEDTRESGLRKLLNFGHTLGHAIELLALYGRAHGVCVAEGMLLEARLGESLGVTAAGVYEQLESLLRAYGFTDDDLQSGFDAKAIVRATATDKKARAGQVHYVLLEQIGTSAFLEDGCSRAVADKDVLRALAD